MKTTFNDGEMKRLLLEFATVNYNEIAKSKSTKGAVKTQAACINRYAKKINGWVHSKIETNYKAKIVKA